MLVTIKRKIDSYEVELNCRPVVSEENESKGIMLPTALIRFFREDDVSLPVTQGYDSTQVTFDVPTGQVTRAQQGRLLFVDREWWSGVPEPMGVVKSVTIDGNTIWVVEGLTVYMPARMLEPMLTVLSSSPLSRLSILVDTRGEPPFVSACHIEGGTAVT